MTHRGDGSPHEAVVRARRCDLTVGDTNWAFAQRHRCEIDAHWQRRATDNPSFFNGAILLMETHSLHDGILEARFLRTEFKNYLFWRETGGADSSIADAFGSALIRSSEGHVLLGRQRVGVNAGLAYPPGGFIDERDVGAGGVIDIAGSVAREIEEETGLSPQALERTPGFILTFARPFVSVGVEFRSPLTAERLESRIRDHIGGDPDSELAEILVIKSGRDLEGLAVPIYVRLLIAALFPGR